MYKSISEIMNMTTSFLKDYINLQQYVIRAKRLPEREALQLFYQLVCIVKDIHNVSMNGMLPNKEKGGVYCTVLYINYYNKHVYCWHDVRYDISLLCLFPYSRPSLCCVEENCT